jgi:hypothetical protein
MKVFTTSFLISLCSIGFSQSYSSTTPIDVASGMGNFHPQLEVLTDGTPAVLWTENTSKNIYFAKHDGTSAFETPIQLNPAGLDVQTYNWSGPDLWIEGDNIYVVFKEDGYSTGAIYMVKSTDSGDTFGDTVRVDQLLNGYGQYPDVTALNDTVWVTFMDHDAGGLDPQFVVARSTDGGATFESEVMAGELWGVEACDCCQPEILVNDSKVVLFLRNNDANTRDIKSVVSYDRGATFTQMFSVDDHNWLINACPSTGPDARFISENEVLAVYKTSVGGEARIYLQGYDIDADATTGGVQIEDNSSSNAQINYPQLDVKDGVIGVAWEAAGEGIDVYVNSSETGVINMNADNAFNVTNVTGTQNKPDISVGDGFFHLVYADSDGSIKYVQLSSLLSIEDQGAFLEMNAYPIPTTTELNISASKSEDLSKAKLNVYNQLGQEVELTYSATTSGIKANVQDLNSGTYHFVVSTEDHIFRGKFIKN